jgi:Cu-Zn family superoxide dismutase
MKLSVGVLVLALPAAAYAAAPVTKALATLAPTSGNKVGGSVTFTKAEGRIKVSGKITGLTPGKHGFHIHEFGDCTAPDGASAGGHFNPAGEPHASQKDAHRHAGDLGNIEANAEGTATVDFVDPVISFEGPGSILGRGVIVHAGEDDFKTQPTGNAGGRLACAVVGVAKGD